MMRFLALLLPRWRLYAALLGALAVFLTAWTLWHRTDAVRDAEQASEIHALENRIEVRDDADKRRNEIESLGVCELVRDGIERLSGDNTAARAAVQRCRADATKDTAADSGVSGPQ